MPRLQGNAVVQAPLVETNVRFGGVGSESTTPTESDGPLFVTTKVKTMLVPGMAVAGPVLTSMRSAWDAMGTMSVEESLPGVRSPPPATTAVLDTLAGADCATDAVTEMSGHEAPTIRASLRVHEIAGAVTVQAQPVPDAAVGVRPAGASR